MNSYDTIEEIRMHNAAPAMLNILKTIENDAGQVPDWLWKQIKDVINLAVDGESPSVDEKTKTKEHVNSLTEKP